MKNWLTYTHCLLISYSVLLAALHITPFALSAQAEDIYKWTDAKGNVHYSTSRKNAGAKPANLPEIKRENFDERIEHLRSITPPNCGPHGGVDCTLGPDEDGSVICLDGNRGAVLPFRFRCLEARVQVNDFVVLDKTDQVVENISKKQPGQLSRSLPHSLMLTLRNNSNVEAFGVEVLFLVPGSDEIEASGPTKVEPFGVADYILPLDRFGLTTHLGALTKTDYKVRCTNCSSIQRAQR